MKRIWYYHGIPTGTMAFWGTHVLRILTVDYTGTFAIDQIHWNWQQQKGFERLDKMESIRGYGIRRCLIGVGLITEVKQRRARLIIGWLTAWDCQVLGHQDIVQRCRVVGLREPRKSDGSSDRLWVGRKITWMDVGAVSIRRDPRKSTIVPPNILPTFFKGTEGPIF